MDTLDTAARSARMAKVRARDTKPELFVRKLIHSMGFRFRLQGHDLPGKPDIVFRSRRKVIFVHGCFWHRHPDPECKLARWPKSKLEFWKPKLSGNRDRDLRNQQQLVDGGWKYLVVWECELRYQEQLRNDILAFLA